MGACPKNVAAKIHDRATWPRVGTDLLLRAALDMRGGLIRQLELARGLMGLKTLFKGSGAEIGIDPDQIGGSAEVLEVTIGECNNGPRNFYEDDVHTAKVHHALRAAAPLTSAGRPLVEKNSNNGGCEQTVDATGRHNCRMNKEYPAEQREAAGEIDDAIFDKVAQDCPNARIMLVHQFGDYTARTHKKDGKPVVTRQVVRDRLVVFRARGVHFCQIPSSPASLRANVEVRLALKEHADRELGRRKDSSYDNDDVGEGMLDVLEILATGEQESPEYQASLNMEKTNELVAMVGNLRLEPLESIMAGVKEFGELYGGRGFTVESGKRDPLSISIYSN